MPNETRPPKSTGKLAPRNDAGLSIRTAPNPSIDVCADARAGTVTALTTATTAAVSRRMTIPFYGRHDWRTQRKYQSLRILYAAFPFFTAPPTLFGDNLTWCAEDDPHRRRRPRAVRAGGRVAARRRV